MRQQHLKESPAPAGKELFQQGILLYRQNKLREAYPLLKSSADVGYPLAYIILGLEHREGRYVEQGLIPKNLELSDQYSKKVGQCLDWYLKQTEPEVRYFLGLCYMNPLGVDKDLKLGFMYCQAAAKQGHAPAQCNLGEWYRHGSAVVDKDEKMAFKCYLTAAEQGLSYAQWSLGRCYETGCGVDKDAKMAFNYYLAAAKQDLAEAQCNLGRCYDLGVGVNKDEKMAVKFFQAAADQGFAYGQFNLGVCYCNGSGVEKNAKKAMECFFSSKNTIHLERLIKENPELKPEAIAFVLSNLKKKQEPWLLKAFEILTRKDYSIIAERQNKLISALNQLAFFPKVISLEILDYEAPTPDELIEKGNNFCLIS